MCYRPIKILNPSRRYNDDMSKYIYVPCGNCADCQRVMHNEWFFRCMIEYQNCISKGGAVYFVTLTYNDDNLPKFKLPTGKECLGFDKRHIHNFVKYFRILLKKNHLMHTEMKYLIQSEYGKNGTKRPHYHGLLFMPYTLPNKLFNDIITTAWHYGFVVCSKFGWKVNGVAGIRYASKYVCKDLGFYKDNLKEYKDTFASYAEYKEAIKPYKDYFPKHWQSVHFGESFITSEILTHSDISKFLEKNTYTLNDGKHQTYPIPRYYHLKLEKYVDKDLSQLVDKVVLLPTLIGKEVKSLKAAKRVIMDMSLIKDICSFGYLETKYPSEQAYNEMRLFFKQSGLIIDELEKDDCRYLLSKPYSVVRKMTIDYIKQHISDFDLFRLSNYRCWLRSYPMHEDQDPESLFTSVTDIIANNIQGRAIPPEFYDCGLADFGTYVAHPLRDVENVYQRHHKTCSDYSYFAHYEKMCRCLDRLDILQNAMREYRTIWKKIDKENTRRFYPNEPIIYKSK